ncbi:MAG: hypothetical protein QOE63_1168 [Acidimicrobiaceae bacterium]
MRVVFLILDAMPPRHVRPDITPNLHALGQRGASAVGRAVMTSATYPNHATFITGASPVEHGLLANWVVADGRIQPAHKVGPAVPTLFDAARAAGRSSAIVVGDHHLIGVMAGDRADEHWPPDGRLDESIVRDGHGYAADVEVVPRLAPLLAPGGPDLLVGHLNEPDTACHMHGPDSEAARATFSSTDVCLGEVVEALLPRWDDTVLIVVSDHDQETTDADGVIELWSAADDRGLIGMPEGSGAVVWGDDPDGGAWLDALDGVGGHEQATAVARIVWAAPRRWFALPTGIDLAHEPGQHGGSRTRDQVAVVAGGHPGAAAIANSITRRRPEAADWAPTIASLLDLDLPSATGQALA